MHRKMCYSQMKSHRKNTSLFTRRHTHPLERGFQPFLAQIWTQGTLRHILVHILVIFEICQFLTIPGPFEYFSENGWSQKIIYEGVRYPPYQFSFRRAINCYTGIYLLLVTLNGNLFSYFTRIFICILIFEFKTSIKV